MNTCLGSGEGILSYRCIYRTVVDEDGCHFTVNHDVQVVNEGTENGHPMTIKLTVSKLIFLTSLLVGFKISALKQ